MLARRLFLLAVLAVAAAVHASAQCIPEPYTGELEALTNSIPSNQQLCFRTLAVTLENCGIMATSLEKGCDWLQLSGSLQGNPTTSVKAWGPLSDGAADSEFEFSMIDNYGKIKLVIVGEPDTSQATFKVTSGRVLQIKAAYNVPATDLNNSSSTASTSTANCQGYAVLNRVAVSGNAACANLRTDPCLGSVSIRVTNCQVLMSNGDSDCPMFRGSINGQGTSAGLAVNYATNSKSQAPPPGYGRKMLQDSQVARAGRMLKQASDFSQGAPWSLVVWRNTLVLRQGVCFVMYTQSGPGVLTP